MDFKNLCQRIDVESIRARIPSMPAMPAMPALPQIKLPKSMPKLKSRKIFRSSRENVSGGGGGGSGGGNHGSPKHQQHPQQHQLQHHEYSAPPIPHAEFIKRTPTRISTISSLMDQRSERNQSTYRSAGSIDDDYLPPSHYTGMRGSLSERPISPVCTSFNGGLNSPPSRRPGAGRQAMSDANDGSGSGSGGKLSLAEKLQKGYKDFSEFRLKHIFAKKTVVRKDEIHVSDYVEQFDEDRRREQEEQERHDRDIAENYRLRFKVSRQNTGHSNSITSNESPASESRGGKRRMGKSVSEHSGDESGMEATPPTRNTGIAAARFNNTRNAPPLRQRSTSMDNEDDEEYESSSLPKAVPISSSLWSIKNNVTPAEAVATTTDDEQQKPTLAKATTKGAAATNKPRSYRERMRRLTSYLSQEESAAEESAPEGAGAAATGSNPIMSKLRGLGKRHQSGTPEPHESSAERHEDTTPKTASTEHPLSSIKQNLKRFQKSIKREPSEQQRERERDRDRDRERQQHQQQMGQTDESEDEETQQGNKPSSRSERLAARLRKFRPRDGSSSTTDIANANNGNSPKKSQDGAGTAGIGGGTRAAITNRIQTFKKSFKQRASADPADTTDAAEAQTTGDENSPERQQPQRQQQKRSGTLIKKLRYIRSRKHPNSTEDLDADDDAEEATAAATATRKQKEVSSRSSRRMANFEEKFEQARQRTLKKVNEKMHHIKFFQKSQENLDKDSEREREKSKAHTNANTSDSDADDDDEEEEETKAPPPSARGSGAFQDIRRQHSSDQEDIEEITNVQQEYVSQCTRAVWTTKPILSDSMESETDGDFPRVLIHQDNSDAFESTLIIAVTRPASTGSLTPKISEILPEKVEPSPAKPIEWVSNKEIITSFLDMTPPESDTNRTVEAPTILPPARKHTRKLSMDSNSDSDSWIPEKARTKPTTTQSSNNSRRASAAGLDSINEREEPWKVHTMFKDERLYKTKSIDIFEKNSKRGLCAAFEDFDDELRNEPIVRIAGQHIDSLEEEDSSEDADAADDDNSSRVTKILVDPAKGAEPTVEPKSHNRIPPKSPNNENRKAKKYVDKPLRQIGNSQESLVANFDETEQLDSDDDRPPSAAPSPPPSISPPPPPLPQRNPPPHKVTKEKISPPPPPLPVSKPPMPPPPKIPERTASMARVAKPLVKTSSLRLAYNEQVKPADVGKVNKLISRFEHPPRLVERPRLVPRRVRRDGSTDYSDNDEEENENNEEDEDDEDEADYEGGDENANDAKRPDHDKTPTNTPRANSLDLKDDELPLPIQRPVVPTKRTKPVTVTTNDVVTTMPISTTSVISKNDSASSGKPRAKALPSHTVLSTASNEHSSNNNNTIITETTSAPIPPTRPQPREQNRSPIHIPRIALDLEPNSNFSRASSEYGSPLEYPSSLMGSNETTPTAVRREHELRSSGRSRRSMTREHDNFYSFDSDEENSYYSLSSSGSSRYIVEI